MERVEFTDCELSNAMLMGCEQKDLELSRCRLNGAEIQSTPLKDVDLSGCELDGISIQPECLRGATVQLAQTPAVLGLFGVKVKL